MLFRSDLMSILFTSDKHVRANNIKLYMLLVTTLILVYNDQYRSFYICMIMFYVCLRGLQPMAEDEYKKIKS